MPVSDAGFAGSLNPQITFCADFEGGIDHDLSSVGTTADLKGCS